MIIGIDASRAFLKRRTGIEEYAYQTIKHLRGVIPETDTVVLYVRKKLTLISGRKLMVRLPEIDFDLPKNWSVRGIWAPRFWTQIALSWQLWCRPPEVLFVPAHTVPFIHPKRSVVTIHGLEYEFCTAGYSPWARFYMRASIRFSCRVAETVICVSENTKQDVIRLYGTPAEKIVVIYEGYAQGHEERARGTVKNSEPYLLFIGRLEERKNIVRMIEAFEILKEKYGIPHRLKLVGKPGFGYGKIQDKLRTSRYRDAIDECGYVTEQEKWVLLKNAEVFLFPTLYEGFGIPVLEAQSVGVPVVTSLISSLPEVAGAGAVYVDPLSGTEIASGIQKVLSDQGLRDGIIEKGRANVERFSWKMCASQVATVLLGK